jgi:DNA polymerase
LHEEVLFSVLLGKVALMDEIFKQLRQHHRRPDIQSFADALFEGRPSFAPSRTQRAQEIPKPQEEAVLQAPETRPETQEKTTVPEQEKTLQSLKRFTQEMAEKQGEAKVKFPGGEISSRPSDQDQFYQVNIDFPQSADSINFKELSLNPKAQVIFLGEKEDQEQVAMLTRMISAMKLSDEDVLRIPLQENLNFEDSEVFQYQFEGIVQVIGLTAPKVVIPLGSKAVSLLFGKKRRLSQVRGKFYSLGLKFNDGKDIDTQMIPIFHPEYLLANPGMKRTAWEDLQKIMRYLGVQA